MKYFKPILGILILVAFVYVCFELIPPFFKNYQLQDYLDNEAMRTSYVNNITEDTIRNEVLKEVKSDELPITAEQIHITRALNQVTINIDYTVHVDLMFFPQDLHFSVTSQNKAM